MKATVKMERNKEGFFPAMLMMIIYRSVFKATEKQRKKPERIC